MKSYVVLAIIALYCMVFISTAVLAIPLNEEISTNEEQKTLIRTKRDLTGIFDSIANGFGGMAEGAKSVSDSIKNAFNSVFSSSNKNSLKNGFEKFKKGISDAANDLQNSVKNGFKQIGDSVKNAFGKGNGNSKSNTPEGKVPTEETT